MHCRLVMNDKAIIRRYENVFDARIVGMTILAIALVVGLMGFVARSFRGSDVSRGASAMTNAQVEPARPARAPNPPSQP
jgi:hypothetical protein